MTTPKVDFRQLIRDGKISSDRAGQLLALDNYEGGGILTDSDESTLRRGVKDGATLNSYIRGSNRLLRMEITYLAMITEIDRDVNYLMWALSAIKHTAVVKYAEPEVLVVTEEKYKQIPKEKHQLRISRTYNLATLYRAILEDIIYNRKSHHKELLEGIEKYATENRKKAKGTDREDYMFGLELIENAAEIYVGWTPYNIHADFTFADLANDLPELHKLVLDEMRELHKSKKISVDPDKINLEKYKDTPIGGRELDGVTIKQLRSWFTAIEGHNCPLDDYWMGNSLPDDQKESVIISTKYQKYAILQNAKPSEIKDGRYKLGFLWELEKGPMFGYSKDKDDEFGEILITRISKVHQTIIFNAKLLTMFIAFRSKAGKLLQIDKGDLFINRTASLWDLDERFRQYEAWRSIYQLDDIQAQISDPDAITYLQKVQEAAAPLYAPIPYKKQQFGSKEERQNAFRSHHPSTEMTKEWLANDKYVKQGLQLIEDMELTAIERVSDRLLDLLREDMDEENL